MVAVLQTDIFGFGAGFQNLRPASELEVLDERHRVALDEHGAIGVLDDARRFRGFLFRPLVSAGGAFPFVGMSNDIFESAGRAGGRRHEGRSEIISAGRLKPESVAVLGARERPVVAKRTSMNFHSGSPRAGREKTFSSAMLRRFFLLLLLVGITRVFAAGAAPVAYTLRFADAAAHYVDVEADVPTEGQETLTLFMPVWTPGSYFVREYARNVLTFDAKNPAGAELSVEKISKNRWRVATGGAASVRISYRLYAREINVRSNWVERDHAMINGAPTFLAVVDREQRPYTVRLELPAGWAGSYTPLAPVVGGAPHTYTAPDFDTLVDSPILAGSPQVDDFEVDGVRHVLVTLGGGAVWDNARVASAFRRIVETQRTFWGGLPYREPYYVFNLLTGSRGGLEHRQSFVMSADRWLSRTRDGINSWGSLASHEYFHVWNGKRLRPVEYGPFEYEHETYSKSLWIVEGITSYYQHVLLARAGLYTRDQYLGAISGSLAGVERTPGRLVQSLSESSFDAWIKAYRPDENSVNALFSYYSGGSIAALLLDVEIRRVSDGARSLDDVMRVAYSRYSGAQGYTEAEFIALVSEVAGHDLREWFRRVVQTPGKFDYAPFLEWYGLEFEKPAEKKADEKHLLPPDAAKGWLGADTAVREGRLVVTAVRAGTPAALAGVSVDDELLAIDGYRLKVDELARRVAFYPPGQTVELLLTRQDKIITVPVVLQEEPKETWKLKVRTDATAVQKERLAQWLSTTP